MKKELGKDFQEVKKRYLEIPGASEYLTSFSVLVGDMVTARRFKLGISQSDLAERAGTSRVNISRIEAGAGEIQLKIVDQVCKALNLTNVVPVFDQNDFNGE